LQALHNWKWTRWKEKINNQGYKNKLHQDKLVIIASSKLTIEEFKTLDKIAIGDPKTVPAGQYARTFMEKCGIYEVLKPKLILAENVRQALDYVERGEVDAGFVYFSDTLKTNLSISPINDSLYPHIVYSIAVIKDSQHLRYRVNSSNMYRAMGDKVSYIIWFWMSKWIFSPCLVSVGVCIINVYNRCIRYINCIRAGKKRFFGRTMLDSFTTLP